MNDKPESFYSRLVKVGKSKGHGEFAFWAFTQFNIETLEDEPKLPKLYLFNRSKDTFSFSRIWESEVEGTGFRIGKHLWWMYEESYVIESEYIAKSFTPKDSTWIVPSAVDGIPGLIKIEAIHNGKYYKVVSVNGAEIESNP